jgi:outer membrane protein
MLHGPDEASTVLAVLHVDPRTFGELFMRVERMKGARAWLAPLMIPAFVVSVIGQATPAAAQQQPPTTTQPAQQTPTAIPPSGQTPPPNTPSMQTPPMPALPSTEAPPQPTGPTKQLTLDAAVQSALEQNLTLQVQKIDPRVQDYFVAQTRTAWIPTWVSSGSYNKVQSPTEQSYLGNASTYDSNTSAFSTGVNQLLPWGTTLSASWTGSRQEANIGQTFNPATKGALNFNFTQPVLRNLSIDNARQQLQISKVNREMSDIQLRQVVVGTVRNVKYAYWNLVGARSNLEVAQQSLALSRQTLKDNQTRVEVGTMAPIDIVQAQAEVANNEEQVIVAQASVQQAEDTLRTLIFDPQSPDFWTQHLEPTDQPTLATTAIDVEAAIKSALDKRTDLQQTQKIMAQSQINIRYTQNQTKPAVNMSVGYSTNALGGVTLPSVNEDGTIKPPVRIGYGSVLGDTFSAAFPSWNVGVSVSYPIGASNAQLGLARARLQYHESELQLRQQQMTVGQQVRDVVRRVNTNLKRIDATRAARELSERKLEAEQKKFAVGLSTSFQVVQAQRDLATARYNEVTAVLDYTTSLADYEAVQETSVGTTTTGGTVTLATASSNGTGSTAPSNNSSNNQSNR